MTTQQKRVGCFLALLLLFNQISWGQIVSQLFLQPFSSSTNTADYIGSSANMLNGISNFSNSPSSISNGALRFTKNGPSSAFIVRTTALDAVAPDFMKFQFRLNVSKPTTLNNNQNFDATLYIGNGTDVGFSDPSQVTAPVTSSIHTQLNIKLLVTASSARFSINNKEYSGNVFITVMINNTNDTVPRIYITPNGKRAMVGKDRFDVWVGNDLAINEGIATTPTATLNKFKFICPSGAPNAILDFHDIRVFGNAYKKPELWASVVKYQPPASRIYVGSPSILRLSNSTIIASHDYFGPNRPRDSYGRSNYTSVYQSTDNGATWSLISNISGMYWANLFEHQGDIYLLGTTSTNGSIAIRKSTNGGHSWTSPTSSTTGLLFSEGPSLMAPRYHTGPTPVLKANGRLYRAFENIHDNTLPGYRGHRAFVISINENDNLLDASKWTKSNEVSFNGAWDPPGSYATTGWLEGNMIEGPDGKIWNMLRVNSTPFFDRSAKIQITGAGSTATFSTSNFITFPGGSCKFAVRRDPSTGIYWAMLNDVTEGVSTQRSVLALYASNDLNNWHLAKTLMEDNQNYTTAESLTYTGFQYPDWQFHNNHIIYLSRTAYGDGVPGAHDSNFITFGRLANFRNYTPTVLLAETHNLEMSLRGIDNDIRFMNQSNDAKNSAKFSVDAASSSYINLKINGVNAGQATVTISDLSGKIIATKSILLNYGNNHFSIETSLAQGIYVATLQNAEIKTSIKFAY